MIRKSIATVAAVVFLLTAGAEAQRRTTKKPPPPAPPKTEAAKVQCRESLGAGVRTQASYCFVLAGRDPAEGVLVTIPSHTGPARLTFDLHNRHTYSEEDVKSGRGFATYTAVIGVLTMKGDLLGRGAVRSEFRKAADLFERIGGGAGPGGVKAVAPTGAEPVVFTVPQGVEEVVLTGERLSIERVGGTEEITAPGRPYAVVSGVEIEYRPAPPVPLKPKRQRR